MFVDLDKEEYKYLKYGLCDYCLLRNIIKKQYDHCINYPDDIHTIRYMYGNYPEYGVGSNEVERFIRYVQYFLNKLIWVPTDKRLNIDLVRIIYSYGNDNPDIYFYKNIKERLDSINTEIIRVLNKYYDFNTNIISFSNYKIPYYFQEAINKAIEDSRFDRESLMKSKFFKSYMSNNYSLAYDLDDYDIKLNGKYWDKYTEDTAIALMNGYDYITTKPAGVDVQKINSIN